MRVEGGCHCGAVRFALDVEPQVELLACNCSICSMTGYRHLIVAKDKFSLLSGQDSLVSYRFGTKQADHLFCGICGVKSFYRPRSHPEGWSVNFSCLDAPDRMEARVVAFDGRNWEQAKARLGTDS